MNPHDHRERALLEELRRAHRVERAPAELRRRMLERFGAPVDVRTEPSRQGSRVYPGPGLRGLAVLAMLAVLLWGGRFLERRRAAPEGQTPEGPPGLTLGPEPAGTGSRAASGEPMRRCPLQEVPKGAMVAPMLTQSDVAHDGLTVHTFGMPTAHCGDLERRYLQYVPRALKRPARAPIMILLHHWGGSAELLRADDTRRNFDALAERAGLVLVYANAAPSAAPYTGTIDSSGWQTDERAHPQIQDHAYLARIVSDLGARGVIAGDNHVFLVGFGAGAAMALAAAAQRPDLYAGVAAFMPPQMYAAELPVEDGKRRLSRALFVLYDEPENGPGRSPLAVAEQWAIALGVPGALAQAQRLDAPPERSPGVRQLDIATPASGGPAVRVTILNGSIDPFPMRGAKPGVSKHSRRRQAFSGADETWAFLTGVEPVDAVFVDDGIDPRYELGDDIVRAPRPRRRP